MSAGGRLDSIAQHHSTTDTASAAGINRSHHHSGTHRKTSKRHAWPLASMTSKGACKSSRDARDGALIAVTK